MGSNDNLELLELYRVWAPEQSPWSAWAKPVLFANLPKQVDFALEIPEGSFGYADEHTAWIIDMPGCRSVEEALVLARQGLRPVPLYNGVHGQVGGKSAVNTYETASAVRAGTRLLEATFLREDALPAFLLDANRMNGSRRQGSYDNRWCVFPQDMPSAAFLKAHCVTDLIVRADELRADLRAILAEYHKQGLAISRWGGLDLQPTPLTQKQLDRLALSWRERWFNRFQVIAGLKRNAAGGFGGAIPDPYAGGGGVYYYGMG